MTKNVEFINRKSGHKVVVGWEDAIRIRCLKRAGYVSAGEYVAPVVEEEPEPEPTVGEVVDSIAEAHPEPEDVPTVAVEAVHAQVDVSEFVDLLDAPESEESDGEEVKESGDLGPSGGDGEGERGDPEADGEGSDSEGEDGVTDDVPEIDLERTANDAGEEVSGASPEQADEAAGGTLDPQGTEGSGS